MLSKVVSERGNRFSELCQCLALKYYVPVRRTCLIRYYVDTLAEVGQQHWPRLATPYSSVERALFSTCLYFLLVFAPVGLPLIGRM